MTVLDINDIAVDLGGRAVLDGIDLSIGKGELVGLVGPNGAGKTTLIRSILGLVPSYRGHILINGSASKSERNRIGYVPQRHEFAWDFPIRVEEAVLYGRTHAIGWFRRAGIEDWRAVRDALERVELDNLGQRPVGELSGGQRQRVLIARALALQPDLLLLDEPSTGLDVPTHELLMDLFVDLANEGKTLLMTTHDLAGATHSCTRLVLINRRVIADGSPAELASEELWRKTFGFREDSPLFAHMGGFDAVVY